MYFYYMIAAMGPKYQKYIWWKKYLTAFQMVQFVAIFIHQFQLLFRECDYPKGFMVWIGLHGAMFLFLFSDFYKTKYTPKPDKASLKNGTSNGTANGVSLFSILINVMSLYVMKLVFIGTHFSDGSFGSRKKNTQK